MSGTQKRVIWCALSHEGGPAEASGGSSVVVNYVGLTPHEKMQKQQKKKVGGRVGASTLTEGQTVGRTNREAG